MGFIAATSVVYEDGRADAYQFGWSHAEMAIEPGMLHWRIKDWSHEERQAALVGYTDRRWQYRWMEGYEQA